MITMSDVQASGTYLDKVMLNSVAFIDSLPLAKTQELDSIMEKYSAETLSKISQLTAFTKFVLDNLTNIQRDVYVKSILDNIEDVRNVNYVALPVAQVQIIINILTSSLEGTKSKVELMYDLAPNSLSIYNDENIEQGINFDVAKNENPVTLKYYEGKLMFKKIVSLISDFTNTRAAYDDLDFSEQYSFVDKFNSILDRNTSAIQTKILLNDVLKEIMDTCQVTECVFAEYIFPDRKSIDLFLGRKYSKIREDILVALKNQL